MNKKVNVLIQIMAFVGILASLDMVWTFVEAYPNASSILFWSIGIVYWIMYRGDKVQIVTPVKENLK